MSNTSSIDSFIQSVVYDHSIATGLKRCESHEDIINYAKSLGFSFSNAEWNHYVEVDWHSLTPTQADNIRAMDVTHWSWAFRQVNSWRAMLMEGA